MKVSASTPEKEQTFIKLAGESAAGCRQIPHQTALAVGFVCILGHWLDQGFADGPTAGAADAVTGVSMAAGTEEVGVSAVAGAAVAEVGASTTGFLMTILGTAGVAAAERSAA